MTKIGLVGTGMLGEAVGLHLLESGHSLTAYNRTKSKTLNLEKNGVVISDTPKRVAESSELVITCVKDADAVHAILFGQNGIVAGKHDGLTVADMSTINPSSAINFSKKLHEEGIDSLEIPVMGGPNVAIDGGSYLWHLVTRMFLRHTSRCLIQLLTRHFSLVKAVVHTASRSQ